MLNMFCFNLHSHQGLPLDLTASSRRPEIVDRELSLDTVTDSLCLSSPCLHLSAFPVGTYSQWSATESVEREAFG